MVDHPGNVRVGPALLRPDQGLEHDARGAPFLHSIPVPLELVFVRLSNAVAVAAPCFLTHHRDVKRSVSIGNSRRRENIGWTGTWLSLYQFPLFQRRAPIDSCYAVVADAHQRVVAFGALGLGAAPTVVQPGVNSPAALWTLVGFGDEISSESELEASSLKTGPIMLSSLLIQV